MNSTKNKNKKLSASNKKHLASSALSHSSPPIFNFTDAGELIEIEEQKENWSECLLKDGTKLRLRPVIMEVRKQVLPGPDGKPQYSVKTTIITDAQHPEPKKK